MNIDSQNFGIFDVMADQGCALVGRETFQIVTSNKAWSQLLEDNVEGDLFAHLPSLDADRMRRALARVGRFQADIEVHNAKRGEMGLRVAISTVEPDNLFVQITDRSQHQKSQAIIDRVVALLEKRNRELDRLNQQLMEARERLILQGRVTALGETARAMICEMQQPLQLISVYAALLDEQLRDPDTTEMLQGMVESSSRVNRVVESLTTLAARPHGETDTCNVAKLVQETLSLCAEGIRMRGIELNVDEVDPELVVRGRPVQLNQALLNLLSNASDALSGDEEIHPRWINLKVFKQDNGVEIAVVDSGHGIPPLIAPKVMDAFFSMKNDGVGSGTGLGLTIARRTVESAGGRLELDTTKPNTYFRMWLPLDDGTLTDQ
jgi:signal transduction histidine kinase